jgi:hypothetical protein
VTVLGAVGALLLLAIAITPTVVVRAHIRRARRQQELERIERVALRRIAEAPLPPPPPYEWVGGWATPPYRVGDLTRLVREGDR